MPYTNKQLVGMTAFLTISVGFPVDGRPESLSPEKELAMNAQAQLPPPGYELVFEDTFDKLSLRTGGPTREGYAQGTGTWTPAGEQGFGYEWFIDPKSGFSPFSVANSVLKIDAGPVPAEIASKYPATTRGQPTCFGGLLSTYDSFYRSPPFYIEARMKLSANPEAWPAFWTLGKKRLPWPSPLQYAKQWENDVMETFGKSTVYFTSIHWNDELGSQLHAAKYKQVTLPADADRQDLSANFHTYSSWVTKSEIIWYFDGREVNRREYPDGSDPDQAQYLIIDLAYGIPWNRNSGNAKTPASVYIDYVRAYAPKE